MSNLSYCRFENTFEDLVDCYDNICRDNREDPLSEREEHYKQKLIMLCRKIIKEAENAGNND